MYESVKILFQLIQKMIEQANEKIDMKLITKRCQAGETSHFIKCEDKRKRKSPSNKPYIWYCKSYKRVIVSEK